MAGKQTSTNQSQNSNFPSTPPPAPNTPDNPPPNEEEKSKCPYNEKSLTEPTKTSSKYGKMIAYSEDLRAWRQIPHDYITKL